jgi:hypothetical protein
MHVLKTKQRVAERALTSIIDFLRFAVTVLAVLEEVIVVSTCYYPCS